MRDLLHRISLVKMPSKRKFCDHCKEYVTLRTFKLHADLYLNQTSEAVYSSSEEEESSRDDSEVFQGDKYPEKHGAADVSEEFVDVEGNEASSPGKRLFLWAC